MNRETQRKTPPRTYSSPVREAAARETRARIINTASTCFTRDGYTATTMRGIAREAGVSVETVNGHGPKGALIVAAFELAFAGREGGAPVSETEPFAEAGSIADPVEGLAAMVHAVTDAFQRSEAIWRALNAAADVDPAVAAALDGIVARRHDEFELIVRTLGERGMPVPADVAGAADVLSLVVSHESYGHLVRVSGWSRDRYESWATGQVLAVMSS